MVKTLVIRFVHGMIDNEQVLIREHFPIFYIWMKALSIFAKALKRFALQVSAFIDHFPEVGFSSISPLIPANRG